MGVVSNLVSSSSSNAPDGFSLQNVTNIVQQYVVAPLAAFGLGGFVFSAEGEAQATLTADISDHYTEDNQAIQDQIAVHPKRVRLKGYVGELVYVSNGNSPSTLNSLTQKLTSISSFLPTLTSAAQQVQQAAANPSEVTFANTLSTASNIYGLIKNVLSSVNSDTPNQQNAYTYFKALIQSGTLMGIQSPWEFMTNMAIESVVVLQGENSKWISDFAITLKEIRIASTISTPNTSTSTNTANAVQSPISAAQTSGITQQGLTPGAATTVPVSGLLNFSTVLHN